MEPPPPTHRRGPRPDGHDTRAAILGAARREFAERGYDGATIRGIARAAGVDARLVHHYYRGKEEVFAAAMSLPALPADIVAGVVGPGLEGIGERLVRAFFTTWDAPERRPVIVGLLRNASSHERSAQMLGQFFTAALLSRVAAGLEGEDPELRVALAASQLLGLALLRYVIRVEPLASAHVEDLVPLLAPVIDRHLTGPVSAADLPGPGTTR